jgi:hypothetical protein
LIDAVVALLLWEEEREDKRVAGKGKGEEGWMD